MVLDIGSARRWTLGGWPAGGARTSSFARSCFASARIFFTRPPRISQADLARIWQEQAGRGIPFLDPPDLAAMKKTNRERDYAVIGELARLMEDVELQIRYSRSARDLLSLANQHADLVARVAETRPALASVAKGRNALEVALDAERRDLIRQNEARLAASVHAASRWYSPLAERGGRNLWTSTYRSAQRRRKSCRLCSAVYGREWARRIIWPKCGTSSSAKRI